MVAVPPLQAPAQKGQRRRVLGSIIAKPEASILALAGLARHCLNNHRFYYGGRRQLNTADLFDFLRTSSADIYIYTCTTFSEGPRGLIFTIF